LKFLEQTQVVKNIYAVSVLIVNAKLLKWWSIYIIKLPTTFKALCQVWYSVLTSAHLQKPNYCLLLKLNCFAQ